MQIMQTLAIGVAGSAADPAYWLDICANMLNTAVNLILDKVSQLLLEHD